LMGPALPGWYRAAWGLPLLSQGKLWWFRSSNDPCCASSYASSQIVQEQAFTLAQLDTANSPHQQ
jgi:hypothetical protein